jgi:broad specificity phosphatase PhoE
VDPLVARVFLVRHGRAAAGWDVDPDPPLDERGRQQALDVARGLAKHEAMPIVSSPLLRCQQTAFPLSSAWGVDVDIEPRVAEIPSPEDHDLSTRVGWLRNAMAGTWTDLAATSGERYETYRNSVVARIAACDTDTVVFSHFVAINVIIGAAVGDDRMVVAKLDNCSVTTVDVATDGTLTIVEMGREADTLIR